MGCCSPLLVGDPFFLGWSSILFKRKSPKGVASWYRSSPLLASGSFHEFETLTSTNDPSGNILKMSPPLRSFGHVEVIALHKREGDFFKYLLAFFSLDNVLWCFCLKLFFKRWQCWNGYAVGSDFCLFFSSPRC